VSRRALIVICLFGVACGGSPSTAPSPAPGAQASAVVVKYLNDLVDIMQANSVNRLVIEWTSFRSQVLSAAGSAQAIADASPAIAVGLGLLNDHHSFYQRPTGGGISNPRFPSGCAVPAVADATVPADIGYLRIGAFSGNTAAEVALATDLHSRIAAQDRDGLAGWIVDLRGNGGGNSALLMPFIQRLASRKNVNRPGGIIVLVGRGTFSSAHLNAVSLRTDLHAVLIGESTGQKPNAYGEVKTFALPHSRIEVRYSTKFWKTEDGDRPSMEPDVTIVPTSADFFAGRDPVLEAALAYQAK